MVTDENNIVLYPFVGTGIAAIVAKKLGGLYIIGFDIDDNYVDIAKNKLNSVESNSKIGSSEDLAFFENTENFKVIKKFIEKC